MLTFIAAELTPGAGVTVTTALTKIAFTNCDGREKDFSLEVSNRAASSGTFNAFYVVRQLPGSAHKTILFANSDFHTAGGRDIDSSGSVAANATLGTAKTNFLDALTPGDIGTADIDVGGALLIELWASVATGTATVDVWGSARPLS